MTESEQLMQPKIDWRRIRLCSLGVFFVVTIGLLATAWLVGSSLIAPANAVVGPPPGDFPAETIEIASDSGATLAAWHLPVHQSTATVILFHAIRQDRRAMVGRARILNHSGYSTLLVDLQAHGESQGDYITAGYLEQNDVLAAVEYVRENSPGQKIGVIGRSLGGASTLFANPTIDVLVIESVYPNLSSAVSNRIKMRLGPLHHFITPLMLMQLNLRLGISPQQLRPVDHIGSVQCPILIASGTDDRHTTLEETRQMYDAALEPKKLVVFEGAGHIDLFAHDPETYTNEIIHFIDANLAPSR